MGAGYRFAPGDPRPEEDTVDGRMPGGEDGADSDRPGGNLDPEAHAVALVGREDALDRIDELLRGGERTVTLVGPTGVGKSALALRAAAAAIAPGGALEGRPAWRVHLESRATAEEVALRVAGSLGFDLRRGEPVDPAVLGPSLAGLGPILLLLDDADAAADVVASAVEGWRGGAPELVVLTTCAAPLDLPHERTVAVPPLGLADGAELFARRAGSTALPQYADRGALAQVLEFLDGLPLAIELAAAWAGLLSPDELASRLAERLDLLEGPTSGPGGPRSLLAAFEAARRLLGDGPRDALGQVAVFAGGFSLEDAEAVLRPTGSSSGLAALRELVGTSLVLHEPTQPRPFRLLRAVREVATARGVPEEARRRHAQRFARLGQPESLQRLSGADAASADAQLLSARDELAAAFVNARGAEDGVTAAHLLRALIAVTRRHGPATAWLDQARRLASQTTLPAPLRCRIALDASLLLGAVGSAADAAGLLAIANAAATEVGDDGLVLEWHLAAAELAGRTDLAAALASADQAAALLDPAAPAGLRARVAATRGAVLSASGRMREGDEALEAAVELARAARDLRTEARALDCLGRNALDRNRPIRARSFHEAALLLSRRLGDPLREAEATLRLAELHHVSGHAADATRALESGAAIHRRLGDRAGEGRCLVLLGELALAEERHPEARRSLEAALEIALQLHDPRLEASARRRLGELYVRLGHHGSGRRHLEQSIAGSEAVGDLELHGGALSTLCELAFAEGDAPAGRELAGRVEELLGAASLRAELVGFLERLAELELADGQHERAEELAGRARREAELSRMDGEATLVRRWT